MVSSKTYDLMLETLERVTRYCPAWTELKGKNVEKRTKALERAAEPLYNEYHTKLRAPAHDFMGSLVCLGETGLALSFMVEELNRFLLALHDVRTKGLEASKAVPEVHAWYKDLQKPTRKEFETAFAEDVKSWKEQLNFEQTVKDVMTGLKNAN